MNLKAMSLAAKKIEPSHIDIAIEIPDLSERVEFDGMKFGFVATCEGEIIAQVDEPPPRVRYLRTDQSVIATYRIPCMSDQIIAVSTYYENAGKRTENTYTITAPRPEKPYESWLWETDKKHWKAPVEPPKLVQKGKVADWNEKDRKWVVIDSGEMIGVKK